VKCVITVGEECAVNRTVVSVQVVGSGSKGRLPVVQKQVKEGVVNVGGMAWGRWQARNVVCSNQAVGRGKRRQKP